MDIRTRLILYLQALDDECTVNLVCNKSDLVAFLDLLQHQRILNAKYHRHARHIEIIQWSVLDRYLAAFLVNSSDFTFAHRRGRFGGIGNLSGIACGSVGCMTCDTRWTRQEDGKDGFS